MHTMNNVPAADGNLSEVSATLPAFTDSGFFSPSDLIPGLDTEGLPRIEDLETDNRYGVDDVGGPNSTSYAWILYSRIDFEGERSLWQKAMTGRIVVDLAGGCNAWGYLLACEAQASCYIGLDAYNYRGLKGALSSEGLARSFHIFRECEDPTYRPPGLLIPRAVVPEDMLTFLRRVPDRSVSVLAIGLHYILPPSYADEVNEQLSRVIQDGGCCVRYPGETAVFPSGFQCQPFGCAWKHVRRLAEPS